MLSAKHQSWRLGHKRKDLKTGCPMVVSGAVVLFFAATSHSGAKDLATLATFVQPAYTVMNYSLMCAQYDPNFMIEMSGPRGTPIHYAEHVKNEAIVNLNNAEATLVLKAAADFSIVTAKKTLYELAVPGDDAATLLAIRKWCETEAKPLVSRFTTSHDDAHETIEKTLSEAQK